jgi:MFS family permease
MRRIHIPLLLANVEEARANGFVVLFTLDAACRALMITIVPLMAYEILGDAQYVSVLYFAVSFAGLLIALTVPALLHLVRRRWVMTIGAAGYVASAALLATGTTGGLIAGLALQVLATATLEVVINLYLLDHVPRRALNQFEPKRLLFAGTTFALGPWLGVTLDRNVAHNLTFLLIGVLALVLVAVFWRLRLTEAVVRADPAKPPPNPLSFIPRFAAQSRLVLAWGLAVGRNSWWLMYFVYVPIYVTAAGYSPQTGGALVSLGLVPMIFVRLWGRIGMRIGIRRLLIAGYGLTGLATVGAAAAGVAAMPILAMGFIWLSALFATVIDGGGNVPYLRAVHPHERNAMTSVYMTFRHCSSLLAPGVFAIALVVAPLPVVFLTGGLCALSMAALSRYLPRGL